MTRCTCKYIHIKRHQLLLNTPQREEFKGTFGQISYKRYFSAASSTQNQPHSQLLASHFWTSCCYARLLNRQWRGPGWIRRSKTTSWSKVAPQKTCATLNNREQRVISDDGREAWKADKQPDDQKLKPENLKSGVAAWPEKDLALLQEMSGLELTRRRRVKLQLQHNTVQDAINTPAGTHGPPPTTVTLAFCRSL